MKFAIILSGCGYLDGAEIRESVLTLLYASEAGAEVEIFAPDSLQHEVVNHIDGTSQKATRTMLDEAARIARGKITPLVKLAPAKFDALIIPGGFGVAKNFSDLAFKGEAAAVNEEIASIIRGFYSQGKPIGAICISPVLVAAVLRGFNIKLTIGEDKFFAGVINNFGNQHIDCATNEVMVDEAHKIVSCSAYMRDNAELKDVAVGIRKVLNYVAEMVTKQKEKAA
jgi:enhancing lycopene biosynthesis protein 2